jgi:hypothetical protein
VTSVRESISADDGGRAAKSIQVTLHTIRRRGELLFPEGRVRAKREQEDERLAPVYGWFAKVSTCPI